MKQFAGTGTGSYSGDSGLASSANLDSPSSIFVDSLGSMYIADTNNHRIRKVDRATNIITTIAGRGVGSVDGDGGPATSAYLYNPICVWVSTNGVVYMADTYNHRIRTISMSGIMNTLAGKGVQTINTMTVGVEGSPTDNVAATSSYLYYPGAVFGDSDGNIYISDTNNLRIRKVSTNAIITTLAGGGETFDDNVPATTAYLSIPHGLFVTTDGTIYVADTGLHRIRKIAVSGIITTVVGKYTEANLVGDNCAVDAGTLYHPYGVWLSSDGTMYVADGGNNRIRKIDKPTTGANITSIGGTGFYSYPGYSGDGGLASRALINGPMGVTFDVVSNSLFFTDTYNYRIRKVLLSTNIITTFAGTGGCCNIVDSAPATATDLMYPSYITTDTEGNVYFSDGEGIRKVNIATGIVTTVVATDNYYFYGPFGDSHHFYVSSSGDLYFAEKYGFQIQMLNSSTNLVSTICGNGYYGQSIEGYPATSSSIGEVGSLSGDTSGNIYFTDVSFQTIWKINTSMILNKIAGSGVYGYSNADEGLAATSASLWSPKGLWIDSIGNIFFADSENYRIRKVSKGTNLITTIAGSGTFGFSGDGGPPLMASLSHVYDVTGDSSGNLYATDIYNSCIRKIDTINNIISTVVGGYGVGASGPAIDPILSTTGYLDSPKSVFGDTLGNIYFADTNNHKIRMFITVSHPTGQPSTTPTVQPTTQPVEHPTTQPTSYPSLQSTSHPTSQPTSGPSGQPTSPPSGQPSSYPSPIPIIQPSSKPSASPSTQPTLPPFASPTISPTSKPSSLPSPFPTSEPSRSPTNQPSLQPISGPTTQPTSLPSLQSTSTPTSQPTVTPSGQSTSQPSSRPSYQPYSCPTLIPTAQPSSQPFACPSIHPTSQPISSPTNLPTGQPTSLPTPFPTSLPSNSPTTQPSTQPLSLPTTQPTRKPSVSPTCIPTSSPTLEPSNQPSHQPTDQPIANPTSNPTRKPTLQPTSYPSLKPTAQPSASPFANPSQCPTAYPTSRPTNQPTSTPLTSTPTTQPSCQPTGKPTTQPTLCPSNQPYSQPSIEPSFQPTLQPVAMPSSLPTSNPSNRPTLAPSRQPTLQPMTRPTVVPSNQPSGQPISAPTQKPTSKPSSKPVPQPTSLPSIIPSVLPSGQPVAKPSVQPTNYPTEQPTSTPTTLPSSQPTSYPSCEPTTKPTLQPTTIPSSQPSTCPTHGSTCQPSSQPTAKPSMYPSGKPTQQPSKTPTAIPTMKPSSNPTASPTIAPSNFPSTRPSTKPTRNPSNLPTLNPTEKPTLQPVVKPTSQPTSQPMNSPSCQPLSKPTARPTVSPSGEPSEQPSSKPTKQPSMIPTNHPSMLPTLQPVSQLTVQPTVQPTVKPTCRPSSQPTNAPSTQPSRYPTQPPTVIPSNTPTLQPFVSPTAQPNAQPTNAPAVCPSQRPTNIPASEPTKKPLSQLTSQPTSQPTRQPTILPLASQPSRLPTLQNKTNNNGAEPIISLKPGWRLNNTRLNVNDRITILASVYTTPTTPCLAKWLLESEKEPLLPLSEMTSTPTSKYMEADTLTSINLVILPHAFPSNADGSYKFTLSCGPSMKSIAVRTNVGPQGGLLTISPDEGFELQTMFELFALGWIDIDLPISYQFAYRTIAKGSSTTSLNSEYLDMVLRRRGEINATSSKLPAGDIANNNRLDCILTLFDSLGANSRAVSSVVVRPMAADELLQHLAFNMSLGPSSSNVVDMEELERFVSLTSTVLNRVNCSAAPKDCSARNRFNCATSDHTCGKCFSGYIGDDGDSNNVCLPLVSLMAVNAVKESNTCILNSDCPLWQECNSSSLVCLDKTKACVSDCSGHGSCNYFNINSGVSLFPSERCTLFMVDCTAACVCESGY